MKRYYFIAVAAATISFFAACNKPGEVESSQKPDVIELTFTSEKPQLQGEEQTKTHWVEDSKTIYWSSSDRIRVAVKVGDNWQNNEGNATSSKGPKLYESNQAGSDADVVNFKVPTYFSQTASGTYSFYGIYPSSVTATDADYDYMPSLSVTVPAEQTPASGSFDSSADILVAVSDQEYDGIPTDKVISLNWTRLVAHGDITLKNLPAFDSDEVVRSITLTAQEGADLAGAHYLDLVTGAFTLPNNATAVNSITIKASGDNLTKNADGNIEFWFVSLPFTATSLTAVITTNKYVYSKTYSSITREFKVNSRNILGISMSGCSKDDAPAEQLIANGMYVISTSYNSTDYMMVANTGSGNYQNYAVLSTTVDGGKIVVDPEAAWQITFDPDDACYYIQNADTETKLTGGAGSSNLTLTANGSDFYIIESGSGYHICTSGTTPRWIGYNNNNGSARFALYKDDSSFPGVVSITPAKVNAVPALTIDAITLGNGAAITEPVTITPSTAKFINSITVNGVYNEAACTSAATWLNVTYTNGNLQYTAEENATGASRTAYVSVKGANDDGDETENVVFSVTQPKVVSYSDKWVLVTNVSEIAVNDKIVIVNTGGTKALGSTQNTNNRNAVDVTLDSEDNNIVNITNTTQQLILGKTGEYWTLYTGSGYLYAASSSDNYLKTQATNDANGQWTITLNASNEATIQAQGTNSRNIIKNNGTIFSCYASGQTAVKIYKYHEDPNAPTLSVSPATTADSPAEWAADNDDAKEFTVTAANGTWAISSNGVSAWANVQTSENVITVTPKDKQASEAHDGTIVVTLTPTNSGYESQAVTIYLAQEKYNTGDDDKVWTLVTDATSLAAGDIIVFAAYNVTYKASGNNYTDNKVMGTIENSLGTAVDVTFSSDGTTIPSLPSTAQQYILGGSSTAWTIMNGSKYLTQGDKKVTEGTGSHTWLITINNSEATVTSITANTYKLQYNPNSGNGRFATYSSTQKAIRIYRYE